MRDGGLVRALAAWGVAARRVARVGTLRDDVGNQPWHVWTEDDRHLVARRSAALRSAAEVEYELAVLRHLGGLGWSVPVPAARAVEVDGRLYSLCAYVPGGPCDDGAESGRPSWRAQPDVDDPRLEPSRPLGLARLRAADPALAEEVERADAAGRAELRGLRLHTLPAFLLHGDFTTANVRQRRGRPCGVIDFDLCHVGCRPWEFAIARLQRAPAMLDGYRDEAAQLGIPLLAEEERVLPAVYRVFRVGMIAWALADGARSGFVNPAFIRVQLWKLRAGLVPTAGSGEAC